jgi:hypothetical protein
MSESSMSEPYAIAMARKHVAKRVGADYDETVVFTNSDQENARVSQLLGEYDAMKQRAEAAEEHRDRWKLRAMQSEQQRQSLRTERDARRTDAARWMVFNVGCIECGVSSDVVGVFETKEKALEVARACDSALSWRGGGQNSFEVFDLFAERAKEYAPFAALDAASPALAVQPTTSTGIHT